MFSIYVSFLLYFLMVMDEFFVKYYFEVYFDFSSKLNSFGLFLVISIFNVVFVLYIIGMYCLYLFIILLVSWFWIWWFVLCAVVICIWKIFIKVFFLWSTIYVLFSLITVFVVGFDVLGLGWKVMLFFVNGWLSNVMIFCSFCRLWVVYLIMIFIRISDAVMC